MVTVNINIQCIFQAVNVKKAAPWLTGIMSICESSQTEKGLETCLSLGPCLSCGPGWQQWRHRYNASNTLQCANGIALGDWCRRVLGLCDGVATPHRGTKRLRIQLAHLIAFGGCVRLDSLDLAEEDWGLHKRSL